MNNTRNLLLKKAFSLFTVLVGFLLVPMWGNIGVYAQMSDNQNSKYMEYIDGDILNSFSEEKLASYNEPLQKGLALFRLSLLKNTDEDFVLSSFEYWEELYTQNEYKNPLTLAYIATLESLYAGALDRGAVKKTNLVKSSIVKYDQATEEIVPSGDHLAIYYIYFLRANTYSSLPTFFREFKKETLPALKTAEDHLADYAKQTKTAGALDENFLNALYANNEQVYGDWYAKSRKSKQAISHYNKALSYVDADDKDLINFLQSRIDDVK